MITKKYYKLLKVSYEDSGYFYIKNVSDQTGTFSITKLWNGGYWYDVEYSTDTINWSTYDTTNFPTITVPAGSNLYLRGKGDICDRGNDSHTYQFSMDVDHAIGGNIYSLVYKDTFTEITSSNKRFKSLFEGDTHLVSAVNLNFGNVSTLSGSINFSRMFYNCTALSTAPELSFATLTTSCYYNMFWNCSSLNAIKCLATNISATSCTDNWLYGVSATGTFYKSANMSGWTTGTSGIPSGWTVVDA